MIFLDFSKVKKDELRLENLEFDAHKLCTRVLIYTVRAKIKEHYFSIYSVEAVYRPGASDVTRVRQILSKCI
jgi:hypothetical protein